MKKLIFTQFFVFVILVMFSACTEKGLGLDEGQKPPRQKVTSNRGIPVFESFEEFERILQEVQKFTPDQRLAWEKQMGFTSFGTMADDIYASVEKMDFKTEKDFYSFVDLNSDYLQIVEDKDESGELSYSLLTKEYNNPERYLMNKDRMYIINTLVYRFYDNNMAVVGPLERFEDLIKFEKLDTLKVPKDCIYYSYIVKATEGSNSPIYPPYPAILFIDYHQQEFVNTNAGHRARFEIGAYTKTTITSIESGNENKKYEARHYYTINLLKQSNFNYWLFSPMSMSVWLPYEEIEVIDFDFEIRSASLNYVNNKYEVYGYYSHFSSPPGGSNILMSRTENIDRPLFYKKDAPASCPEPWTFIVAHKSALYWWEYWITYELGFCLDYANTITYY